MSRIEIVPEIVNQIKEFEARFEPEPWMIQPDVVFDILDVLETYGANTAADKLRKAIHFPDEESANLYFELQTAKKQKETKAYRDLVEKAKWRKLEEKALHRSERLKKPIPTIPTSELVDSSTYFEPFDFSEDGEAYLDILEYQRDLVVQELDQERDPTADNIVYGDRLARMAGFLVVDARPKPTIGISRLEEEARFMADKGLELYEKHKTTRSPAYKAARQRLKDQPTLGSRRIVPRINAIQKMDEHYHGRHWTNDPIRRSELDD